MKIQKATITIVFLLITNIVFSQAAILALLFGEKVATEKFNISLEVGLPINSFSNVENSSAATGINFGIAGNIKLSENWFISPTAYFLSKRTLKISPNSLIIEDPGLSELYKDVSSEILINYTDVNVLVAYQPNRSNFRFGISPQVSFFNKARATFKNDLGKFEQNINTYTNSIDYGLIGNVGYFLKSGHKGKGIHFNLRYYQGFTDVFTDNFISGKNKSSYVAFHISLPFITDELAEKNKKPKKNKKSKKTNE